MSVPTGGAVGGDPAYFFSGGVPNTVNPADTILTPDSNMQLITITLSKDQIELVATAAKTLNEDSPEETSELSKLFSLLKETMLQKLRDQNVPVEKAQLRRLVKVMPRREEFTLKKANLVLAILLADSETTRHVSITSPTGLRYSWPEGTACILPKLWSIIPGEKDVYAYMVTIFF